MAGRDARQDPPLAEVGVIAGPRGLKGEVWVRSFTADPADIAAYGPLVDEERRRTFILQVLEAAKDRVLARIDGVADRTAAEALTGTRLFAPRAAFGEPAEEEYFQADLVGLAAETVKGERLGRVVAVQNFGAGDLLEVEVEAGSTVLVPFTRAVVPEVDVSGGRVVVDPPPGLIGEA
jgi:16S rRNA processing protein RimM